MPQSHIWILNDQLVCAALKQAWTDSRPGLSGDHEEGGFVIQESVKNLAIVRWPKGAQDSIQVSRHPSCKIGDNPIVASFHTHPNTGNDYLQEPSETDMRAVRDDPDLKGSDYIGEFVISSEVVFLITPTGQVREVAQTRDLFSEV